MAAAEKSRGHSAGKSLREGSGWDSSSFHAFFERYSRPVLSFIYRMMGDRAVAEELTQETFVRAYLRRSSMAAGSRESTWVFGIARNVVREAVKRKYRRPRAAGTSRLSRAEGVDGRPLPDGAILVSEMGRAIREAVGALSEDQRVVFVLKLLHRMSYVEIAEITGSSIGKLKTDLHRARVHMRERLKAYWRSESNGK